MTKFFNYGLSCEVSKSALAFVGIFYSAKTRRSKGDFLMPHTNLISQAEMGSKTFS